MSGTNTRTPEVAANGHVGPGFIIQQRKEWVEIQEGDYQGARFRAWTNHPMGLWNQAFDDDAETRYRAFAAIFLEHDRWGSLNGDGEFVEYPPISDTELFEQAIPQDLVRAMVDALRDRKRKSPLENKTEKTS